LLDLDEESDILIKSYEATGGAKVKILAKKTSSKFKKGGFEIGDVGFIKIVNGNPWETNSDLIWITKDGKKNSESYGFRPEDLELTE